MCLSENPEAIKLNCSVFVFPGSHQLEGMIHISKMIVALPLEVRSYQSVKGLKCQANAFRNFPTVTESGHW